MRVGTNHQPVTVPSTGAIALAAAPAADRVLTAALDKLGGQISEIVLLALEKESTRLERDSAKKTITALGKDLERQHATQLKQMRDAMQAATHKGWLQKLLTVCKIVSAAAGLLSGGALGAIAGALILASMALEKSHPKIALGLQLAAAGLMVGGAAADLVAGAGQAAKTSQVALDSATKSVQTLDGVTLPAGVSWQAVANGTAAVAHVGAGVATVGVGYYAGQELHIQADQLRTRELVENDTSERKDGLKDLREVYERDERATGHAHDINRLRSDIATASLRA
ncbi:MAG TPA: hypothetical protein VGQ83_31740 [Polyangia bacterium]|jgi:hypothetical protein